MNPILSFVCGLISGLIIGIFGTYFGNRLSERAKHKDSKKAIIKKYLDIKSKMPDLINEMKADLGNPSNNLCREFLILHSKSVLFNVSRPAFAYYENEHDYLISKVRILESTGFVNDITDGDIPRYQFDEKFVDLLSGDGKTSSRALR